MLHIVVSANTPPGSYHFTLRGETQGTFKTSEDMVTVVVQPSPKSHENNNNQPKNETSQTSSAPIPVTKAQAAVSSQASKKAGQNKPGVVRGLVAAVVVLAVVGTVLYMSRNLFHNDINSLAPSGSPTTTTYAGTQTFTIYSALGGAPETSTGAANVQVDSSGDVLGPVLFGKITNGVFTGQAQTSDGTVTPMTGTLSDGNFTASYQSSSHSWIWICTHNKTRVIISLFWLTFPVLQPFPQFRPPQACVVPPGTDKLKCKPWTCWRPWKMGGKALF
ncbi:MAG: hypothetical protein WAU62_11190 [Dehalococcoidales bacterium]